VNVGEATIWQNRIVPSATSGRDQYQPELVGLKAGEQRPDHLLQAIGKNYQILHSAKVDAEGNFALPADALKNSEQSRQ